MVSVTNGPLFGNSGFDDLTVVELPNLVEGELADLIAAASAPGLPSELAGEDAARSMFEAAQVGVAEAPPPAATRSGGRRGRVGGQPLRHHHRAGGSIRPPGAGTARRRRCLPPGGHQHGSTGPGAGPGVRRHAAALRLDRHPPQGEGCDHASGFGAASGGGDDHLPRRVRFGERFQRDRDASHRRLTAVRDHEADLGPSCRFQHHALEKYRKLRQEAGATDRQGTQATTGPTTGRVGRAATSPPGRAAVREPEATAAATRGPGPAAVREPEATAGGNQGTGSGSGSGTGGNRGGNQGTGSGKGGTRGDRDREGRDRKEGDGERVREGRDRKEGDGERVREGRDRKEGYGERPRGNRRIGKAPPSQWDGSAARDQIERAGRNNSRTAHRPADGTPSNGESSEVRVADGLRGERFRGDPHGLPTVCPRFGASGRDHRGRIRCGGPRGRGGTGAAVAPVGQAPTRDSARRRRSIGPGMRSPEARSARRSEAGPSPTPRARRPARHSERHSGSASTASPRQIRPSSRWAPTRTV